MTVGLKPFLVASSREGLDSTELGSDSLPCVTGQPHGRVVADLLRCAGRLDAVPAVVILDVAFDPAGLEIVRGARQHPMLRRTPFAALATSADQPLVERMYDAGVNSVVPRPETAAELRELLERITEYWLEANYVSGD